MSIPKAHHELPEMYLEGFASEGQVWAYDRKLQQIRQQPIRVTTIQKHFYSFTDKDGNKDTSVENPILSGIEGAAKPVIAKIERKEELSVDDKWCLALFVALLFARTRQFEFQINQWSEQFHKFLNQHLFQDVERVRRMMAACGINEVGPEAVTAEKIVEFVSKDEYKVCFERNHSLEMMLDSTIHLAPILANLNWSFGFAESRNNFITTDNPFIISPPPNWNNSLLSGRGVLVRGATKGIPLSSKVFLSMGDSGNLISKLDFEPEQIQRNNLAVAARSNRWILSYSEVTLRKILDALGMATI